MNVFRRVFGAATFKIFLLYFLILGLGFFGVLFGVGWNVRELVDHQVEQTINADINGLSEQYAEGGVRQLAMALEQRLRSPGGALYLLQTPSGAALAGNIAETPEIDSDGPKPVETLYQRADDTKRRRAMMRLFILPSGFRLMVGQDMEDRARVNHIVGGALFASLFWLLAVGAFGGFLIAKRLLNRVDRLSASAAALLQGDTMGRLPLSGTDDALDRLARNLNAMLDRINCLITSSKQVSDNIAHDLRTPLTRLRNHAEQALTEDMTLASAREALTLAIEEADGLIRIFNALLLIARAESGTSFDRSAVDISHLAADMAELYEPAAEDVDLTLTTEIDPGLVCLGQREIIGQALANLIDNALKYGSGGDGRIQIQVRRNGGMAELIVADHGAGVAEADRLRVTDRFVRLEEARSLPGSGLGLSLVAAAARLHGGSLRLEDHAPGLRAVLSLPLMKP